MDLAFTILSTAGTIIAAIAALGSWKAANRADKAASSLTAIEQDRRHSELTPEFRFEFKDPGNGQPLLRVYLDGPASLSHLDRIDLTVRDDMPNRERFAVGSVLTEEDIKAQIWGPFRFVPIVDGASQDGRTMAPFDLPVGESRRFALEPTTAPRWDPNPDWWREQRKNDPLRLTVQCSKDGHEPWLLKFEVQLEEMKALEAETVKELPAAPAGEGQ